MTEARPVAGPSPVAADEEGVRARASPAAGPGLVFAGCEEPEVALAKSFWNSVTLQPPLESRLGPRKASVGSSSTSTLSNARSRDSAAGLRRSHLDAAQKSGLALTASVTNRKEETGIQGDPEMLSVDDQKAQYVQKAKRREEILALLRKQREERIKKEAVSQPYHPKSKMEESKLKVPESDVEDRESVKALI